MNTIAGIYKIINKTNGKIYIGESENINKRWDEHLIDLIIHEHCNYKLQNDFNESGVDNFYFDIIESVEWDTSDPRISNVKIKLTLLCREFYYIKKYNSINKGYNISNSLNDIILNKCDIFERNKKANIKMINIVRKFLKNNKILLTQENVKLSDFIYNSHYKTKINNKTNNKTNRFIQSIYKEFKDNKKINYVTSISIFYNILKNNNIIYFDEHWKPSDYSLENNLIVCKNLVKRKNSSPYYQIEITDKGFDKIKEIFNVE